MSDQPSKGNEDKPAGYEPPQYVPPAQFSAPEPLAPEPLAPEPGAQGQAAPEQGAPVSPPFEQPTQQFDQAAYNTQPLPPYEQNPYGQPAEQNPYGQPPTQSAYTPGDYSQQPPSPYGQPPSPYQQPYGQPSPYGQPAYYGMPAQPKALSIASMCCGIAIFVGFGFFILPQIGAVVLGHLALKREPAGKGMAIAGLVMGYIGVALTLIFGIIFFAAIASSRSSFNY
ncbi:DUF4190 domain-containing protein [Paenarthrobacter sp. NPDC056912]|uniref:DUF4190 domain-containing protein n=1 Tax=Paenarthrobacter sp. NPDC056912 TaxID=3345965 RepID=UPI00366ED0E0